MSFAREYDLPMRVRLEASDGAGSFIFADAFSIVLSLIKVLSREEYLLFCSYLIHSRIFIGTKELSKI